MSADLDRLFAETDAMLLDFDGPVCGILAGYPARDLAAELVDVLHRHGIDVPSRLTSETDRWSAEVRMPCARQSAERSPARSREPPGKASLL